MIKYYRLNDNNEVQECDMFQAEEFLTSPRKIVKQEDIGDKWISTVMLGIDHSYGYAANHVPVLFETMIQTTGQWDGYLARYYTYQEALDGHNAVIEKLKQGLPLDDA